MRLKMQYRMKKYTKRLFHIVSEKKFWLQILGEVEGHQIWLVRTRSGYNGIPNLLVCSGFHGEEIAGPLAILYWLEQCDGVILKKVNLSFLPCVSPVAFDKGNRYARSGERTNCGFYHTKSNGDVPSREGRILIENIDLLKKFASDGFLSLHEDITSDKFYIYTFEKSRKPGPFTYALRNEEAKFFDVIPDGERVNEEGDPEAIVKDGIVWKLHDGSFEDLMFHLGVPRTVVTETPGKKKLSKRIEAGVALIDKFVELSLRRV